MAIPPSCGPLVILSPALSIGDPQTVGVMLPGLCKVVRAQGSLWPPQEYVRGM